MSNDNSSSMLLLEPDANVMQVLDERAKSELCFDESEHDSTSRQALHFGNANPSRTRTTANKHQKQQQQHQLPSTATSDNKENQLIYSENESLASTSHASKPDDSGKLLEAFTCKICLNQFRIAANPNAGHHYRSSSHLSTENLNSTCLSSLSFSTTTTTTTTSDAYLQPQISSSRQCYANSLGSMAPSSQVYKIKSCGCKFCKQCLSAYIKQSILNYNVSPLQCPDATCRAKGFLAAAEIRAILLLNVDDGDDNESTIRYRDRDTRTGLDVMTLSSSSSSSSGNSSMNTDFNLNASILEEEKAKNADLYSKYLKMCENIEILHNPNKTHCPRPDCQNVCVIPSSSSSVAVNVNENQSDSKANKVVCDKCNLEFCSLCMKKCPSRKEASEEASSCSSDESGPSVESDALNNTNSNDTSQSESESELFVVSSEQLCESNAKSVERFSSSSSGGGGGGNGITVARESGVGLLLPKSSKTKSLKHSKITMKQRRRKSTNRRSLDDHNQIWCDDHCQCSSAHRHQYDDDDIGDVLDSSKHHHNLALSRPFSSDFLSSPSSPSSSNGLFENLENIKRCPKCNILIERADGCAQVMCKLCKHTFCFYCLTSLDNDFMLKHYTKNGPCKGKLGHSRISLLFHRLSVVGIFSGTIILIIVLSPFILLSLPCLIFSRKFRKSCFKLTNKFG